VRLKNKLRPVWLVALCTIVVQMVVAQSSYADGGSNEHGRTVYVWSKTGSSGQGSHLDTRGSRWSGPGDSVRPTYWCSYAKASPSMVRGFFTPSGRGTWYKVTCFGGDLPSAGASAFVWIEAITERVGRPLNVLRSGSSLAKQAESSISLPSPEVETNPADQTFVNLRTWFWIARSEWHPLKATAASGDVKVTAVAEPVLAVFVTGDGTTLRCSGGGTPYDLGLRATDQFSSCTHVYIRSSAGQSSPNGDPNDAAFLVRATITWRVYWYETGSDAEGTLPQISTTSTSWLRVEQIESVQDS
jgi:hypothetical protein